MGVTPEELAQTSREEILEGYPSLTRDMIDHARQKKSKRTGVT